MRHAHTMQIVHMGWRWHGCYRCEDVDGAHGDGVNGMDAAGVNGAGANVDGARGMGTRGANVD